MKSRKQFVLIVALLGFSILACQLGGLLGDTRTVRGTGDIVEETRAVSGVSGVNLATIGDLVIEVKVRLPRDPDGEERQLLERLDELAN